MFFRVFAFYQVSLHDISRLQVISGYVSGPMFSAEAHSDSTAARVTSFSSQTERVRRMLRPAIRGKQMNLPTFIDWEIG